MKYNKKLLGKDLTDDILHDSYKHLHIPAFKDAFFEDEVEQTFDAFVKMGKQDPDVYGNGRWKYIKDKRCKLAVFINKI